MGVMKWGQEVNEDAGGNAGVDESTPLLIVRSGVMYPALFRPYESINHACRQPEAQHWRYTMIHT